MKKLLIIILCFSLFLTPVKAKEAETLGDLRKEYESLVAEKAEYDRKSEQAKQEIKNKQSAITKAQGELTEAEVAEEEAQVRIDESNIKIAENKLESEKVLVFLQQMESKNSYLEYISGSSSITELVMRIEAIKQVSEYIQITLNNLEEDIKENEQLKIELEALQKELAEKITSYEAAIKKLYSSAEEYDEFSLGLDDKLATAKENYEVNKEVCINALGKSNVSDSTKLKDCSKMPVNTGWLKPLTKGVVTSPMGYRTHPVTGKVYTFHNGIDVGVSEGTPIYAAASGKVVARVANSSCGGNMLFIDVTVNGKNYTTYYYHLLRFNVNVGDIVTQNSIIGYVGGYSTSKSHGGYDSCTTGAHLHFGVQNGWYSTSRGVVQSNVIVPPGFRNVAGYRFYSRTDMYSG